MAEEPRQPEKRPRVRPRFWVIVLVLLAVNYLSVALFAPGKEKSVRIPYSPEFLSQVDKGNVKKVSATGATVSGELKSEITYPPGSKDAKPAKTKSTKGGKPGATGKPAGRVHVVKKGETLGGIAQKYSVSIASIVANNNVGREKRIRIIVAWDNDLAVVKRQRETWNEKQQQNPDRPQMPLPALRLLNRWSGQAF